MRVIPVDQTVEMDYSVTEIFSMCQYWQEKQVFSALQAPKANHALLYFAGCDGLYEGVDGTTLTAHPGDIMFLPKNSRYKTTFFNTQPERVATLLINFQLSDACGSPFTFSDEIICLAKDQSGYFLDLFSLVAEAFHAPVLSYPQVKSIVYKILSKLAEAKKSESLKGTLYGTILPGILYLENDPRQEKSLEDVAEMCHVSPTYFRKLFRQYAGVSPVEFRLNSKLERARQLLETGMLPVQEVAFRLGFEDASYFSRMFKKKTGVSPSAYAQKAQGKEKTAGQKGETV